MKKLKLFLFALMGIAFFAIFTGCEKYEASTPYVINDSITATLTGVAYANLDLTASGNEFVPAGTKIFIKVELNQYNPNIPSGEFKTFVTSVGQEGRYRFSLPSNDNGINFTIVPDQFEYEQVQADSTTVNTVFSAPGIPGFALSNQTVVNNIYY